jgi:hypothetical protein
MLARLTAEPAHQNVVSVHNHPGEVMTEIFKNGCGGKTMDPAVMHVAAKTGMSVEPSGERSLYLVTSAQFRGKGVPLSKGVVRGLTVSRTERYALFCVDERIECIQQEYVLGQLKSRNADEIIWEKTQEVLTPYF